MLFSRCTCLCRSCSNSLSPLKNARYVVQAYSGATKLRLRLRISARRTPALSCSWMSKARGFPIEEIDSAGSTPSLAVFPSSFAIIGNTTISSSARCSVNSSGELSQLLSDHRQFGVPTSVPVDHLRRQAGQSREFLLAIGVMCRNDVLRQMSKRFLRPVLHLDILIAGSGLQCSDHCFHV